MTAEQTFDRWLLCGRNPVMVESAEHRESLLAAFNAGWADRGKPSNHRAYPGLSGERWAYITGRQLGPVSTPRVGWDPKDAYTRELDDHGQPLDF